MAAQRRVRRDPPLVEVVLEGDDDAVGAPAPSDPSHPTDHAGTGRPAPRRWWLIAAGVALALAAAAVALDRREAAEQAELAAVPGILTPLAGPVVERWRTDVALRPGLVEVAGRLVGVESRADGSVAVVALDPGTGRELWRAPARAPGAVDVQTRCALPSPGTALVACVVVDEVAVAEVAGAGRLTYPPRTRVVVVDAATEEIVHDGPVEPRTSVATLGADLVLGDVGADGRVRVRRTDARAGAERWTFTSPEPLPLNAFRRRDATVTVAGGLVVVDGGSIWVLSAAGDVLRAWAAPAGSPTRGRVEVLRAGRLLYEQAAADDGTHAEIVDLATGRAFAVDGSPVVAVPDDGSLAEVVLVQSPDGELIAYELASGRRRWAISSAGGGGTVIRAGRVVRGEGDELQSIDGRTGELVWAVPAGQAAFSPLASDGHAVLVTGPAAGRGLVLTAFGLDDGRRLWAADVPDGLYALVGLGGRLYGRGGQLVAFGPSAGG
ncbi:outer membrane protein assembly factor BamB family protein [Pengzhenrongella sicca]|uniref:PQQ-binding-like beta-propeller repeat protein n=1 Tax=Pengzhenrongella sicca TaxID=2819238 RepID=A0A8A4ZE41_9MICO|nr:PQQ-binding-like beta-propeller repeat protein [Pengzhenrongella sicca]QTE29289.1 PQQ-binding-like beta-propeller repeat protein [Pengzhenrongella sicca]